MTVRTRVWSRWELDPRLPEAATELRMTEFPAAGEESDWSVLLLPGGAYRMTAPREGAPVAAAFAAAGIHAWVLDYSVAPDCWPQPFLEAGAALSRIRRGRGGRVAVCGFSAGGHLAGCLANLWGSPVLEERLGLRPAEARPDAVILGYPVVTAGAFRAADCFRTLTGADDMAEIPPELSLENSVTAGNPPAFLWCTGTDDRVPAENTLLYVAALRRAGVPFELHLYPDGPHAMALADRRTQGRPEQQDPHVATWFPLCLEWLKGL